MPERLFVSLPDVLQELRDWAQAISDVHYTIGLLLERDGSYLPGEQMEAARLAWSAVADNFRQLILALDPAAIFPAGSQLKKITSTDLESGGLNGPIGVQKRSFLNQLRDRFLSYYWSTPITEEMQRKASEAAAMHLDLSAVALDSLGIVPGWDKICKITEEGVLGFKHLLEVRGSRGH